MGSIKFGAILLSVLALFTNTASAVEFEECSKFINKDKYKYLQCAEYSFIEATQKGEYQKARNWLSKNRNEDENTYNQLLTILMCGTDSDEGSKPFNSAHRQGIINVTDDLLRLGASFDSMPMTSIVTPLFCLSNRKDSVILDHVLTRIKATSKDLNASLYEGVDPSHVPLNRAILNHDLESAKVLVKHGATPDFSVMDDETALKKALELHNAEAAIWLLDMGASAQMLGNSGDCSGTSALDYALEIPENVEGRDQVISRIQLQLQQSSAGFKPPCNGE